MTETATARTGVPVAGTAGGAGNDGGGVRAAAHTATEEARGLAATGKQEAGKVMEEVRSQTSNLLGEAGHRARDRADSQVGNAARLLGDMSDELDRMAAASTGSGPAASLARDGATAMRSLSRRLDEGGLDAAMDDVRGFARRRPVVFLAGAFAVGMLAGRLARNVDMRSVAQRAQHDEGLPTGTTSRLEQGMDPELDDAIAAGAGAGTLGTADLTAGVEADWDAPTAGRSSGWQA